MQTWKLAGAFLLLCLAGSAQVPGRIGRGSGLPGGRDWWEGPLIGNLNLSEAQRKQIQTTTREYRNRLVDARATAEKAEGDLQDAFNDATADDRRINDLIDRVVKTRGEMMKLVTQMSWKLRGVLTMEQWQELQRRRPEFSPRFRPPDAAADERLRGSRRPGAPQNPPPPQGKQ